MSAAATAAGYLYASGRLRGRGAREQDHNEQRNHEPRNHEARSEEKQPPAPREVRVAVLPQPEDDPREERPRKTPKIEYRTRRRWSAA